MSFLSIAFDTGNRRQLSGLPGRLAQFLGASISVWVLYSATLSRLDVLSITISFYSAMLSSASVHRTNQNSRGGTTTHRLVP